MKEKLWIHGLRLGKPGGGMISCAACGQILGYLSPKRGGSSYLHFLCKCGNSGYLRQEGQGDAEQLTEIADLERREVRCSVCRQELFSVSEQVGSFGFRIQCTCGHVFDSAYLRKRRVYEEEMGK